MLCYWPGPQFPLIPGHVWEKVDGLPARGADIGYVWTTDPVKLLPTKPDGQSPADMILLSQASGNSYPVESIRFGSGESDCAFHRGFRVMVGTPPGDYTLGVVHRDGLVQYLPHSVTVGVGGTIPNRRYRGRLSVLRTKVVTNPGDWLDRCDFDRSPVAFGPHVLFTDCEWRGTNQWDSACRTGNAQETAFLYARFLRTDRGPVLQSNSGPTRGLLFSQLFVDGLHIVANGNEGICFDDAPSGGEQADNLVMHYRYTNSSGQAVKLGGSHCKRLHVRDAQMCGDVLIGPTHNPQGDGSVDGITFDQCEWLGGGVVLDGNVANVEVANSAFCGFRPTRANQVYSNPAYYRTVVCESRNVPQPWTNVLRNVQFWDVPTGYDVQRGWTVSSIWRDGAKV